MSGDHVADGRGLDELLEQLERLIVRLADPAAPLDRLVADFEEAGRLLEASQASLDAAARRVAELELERSLQE